MGCGFDTLLWWHYAGGPRRPPPPQLQLRWSRDLAHASIPLAQTPWGLTGRAWLQAGAQQAVIAVDPSFNSLGIDSRNDVIMSIMASQLTSLTIVYSTVYSGVDQRKHQSSAILAFVRGIHQWPVNSQHKGRVTQIMFPFDDIIIQSNEWKLND